MTDVMALSLLLREEGAATIESALRKLGGQVATAVVSFEALTRSVATFVAETSEGQFATARLKAALEAAGGVSGRSLESLQAQASALQDVSIYSDEAVMGMMSLLASMHDIRGEIFNRAIPAIVNLASLMETDLKSAALQVGKALQDPENGLTALTRVGIKFTDAQKELIAEFIAANNYAAAQEVILSTLEGRAGTTARELRDTLGGALVVLKNKFKELFEFDKEQTSWLSKFFNWLAEDFAKLKVDIANVVNYMKQFNAILNIVYYTVSQYLYGGIGLLVVAIGRLLSPLAIIIGKGKEWSASLDDLTKVINAGTEALGYSAEEWEKYLDVLRSDRQPTEGTTQAVVRHGKAVRDVFMPAIGEATTRVESYTAAMSRYRREAEAALVAEKESAALEARRNSARLGLDVRQAGFKELPNDLLNKISDVKRRLLEDAFDFEQQIPLIIGSALAGGIADGLTQGFQRAFEGGGISEGFKALTASLLGGLGTMLIQFGQQALLASDWMIALLESFRELNPYAGAAAAIGMIALGAALKGAAQAAFGRRSTGGGGSYNGAFSGSGMSAVVPRMVFGGTSATQAVGMTPIAPMNITVIGPNDPSAQRAIQELITKANRRGNV